MKYFLYIALYFPLQIIGQYDPKIESYQHRQIIKNKDTINYHIYCDDKIAAKNTILIYFHGSGPYPLFSQRTIVDTLNIVENGEPKIKIETSKMIGSCVPIDLDKIPSSYIFVIISKKGVPFFDLDKSYTPNKNYFLNEGLDYRVWQGDEVINDITKTLIKKPNKIVILGHSEGSDVVAKLGHTNKKVTHIGYWAGGANTQYYEFALMIQKSVLKGEISQEDAVVALDSLFLEIKNIQQDPNNIEKQWWGNSYRRWAQFTTPSIDNLLKINKPLFVAVGGKDDAVPFESSLLIPIEFLRQNKNNLTFKMYPNHNHSFAIVPENENEEWIWDFMTVFDEFLKWIDK